MILLSALIVMMGMIGLQFYFTESKGDRNLLKDVVAILLAALFFALAILLNIGF